MRSTEMKKTPENVLEGVGNTSLEKILTVAISVGIFVWGLLIGALVPVFSEDNGFSWRAMLWTWVVFCGILMLQFFIEALRKLRAKWCKP